MEALTLLQLNQKIKNAIAGHFTDTYWIVAEISEINENRSGHAYLELIEKDDHSDKIIAKTRANIWANIFRFVKAYFESTTKQSLQNGMKILINATVEFHELYGISLNIRDIDANYTIGDLQRRRQLIIEQLQAEGIFEMNHELEIPMVPQRIAVITSETAAGYGDFTNQLKNNPYGFKFSVTLFQAIMQGDKAEQSIIDALEDIYLNHKIFDIVVIIRGGGSKTDLLCFDSYNIAQHITQFPLPVITGIGHDRDQSIADMVAHTALKTPTAVAEFIIEKVLDFDRFLNQATDIIKNESIHFFDYQKEKVLNYSASIVPKSKELIIKSERNLVKINVSILKKISAKLLVSQEKLTVQNTLIFNISKNLIKYSASDTEINFYKLQELSKNKFRENKQQLNIFDTKVQLHDIENILKLGFVLTRVNGKHVKSIKNIEKGNLVKIQYYDGFASGEIKEKQNNFTPEQ